MSYSRKNLRKQTLVIIYDFGNFGKNIAYNVWNVWKVAALIAWRSRSFEIAADDEKDAQSRMKTRGITQYGVFPSPKEANQNYK